MIIRFVGRGERIWDKADDAFNELCGGDQAEGDYLEDGGVLFGPLTV